MCSRCLTTVSTMGSSAPASTINLTSLEGIRLSIPAGRAVIVNAEPFAASVPSHSSRAPATCGEIIEAVADVIASQPPYLSRAAMMRHLCLLDHLLRSRYEVLGLGANLSGPIRTEPLDRFGVVLRLWIDSFLYRDQDTLSRFIGVCALDTALALLAIAFGGEQRSMDGSSWRLAGLLPPPSDDRYRIARLRQPAYKRAMIGALADRWLLARVPAGASIVISGQAEITANEVVLLLATPSKALNQDSAPRYRLNFVPDSKLVSPACIPGLINTGSISISPELAGPIHLGAPESQLAVPAQFDAASSFVPLDWIVATAQPSDSEQSELIATPLPWCR